MKAGSKIVSDACRLFLPQFSALPPGEPACRLHGLRVAHLNVNRLYNKLDSVKDITRLST